MEKVTKKNVATTKASMSSLGGLICGILAPISFGFMPLFTMPLINAQMSTASILAYRFAIAAFMLLIIMLVRGINLKVKWKQLLVMVLLGLIYVWSAAGVQIGYRYMPTGISTTVHFIYPIWVILIMLFVYRQRPAWITVFAISLAILGVASLTGVFGSSQKIPFVPFLIVASTGLAYAIYMVIMSRSGVNKLHPVKVSFYVMLTAAIAFTIISISTMGIQIIPGYYEVVNVILLCLVSTVLANILLVVAIKHAGATTNSVLGALEPLTAVVMGILFLDEKLTLSSIVGIGFIIIAVLTIALSGRIAYWWKVMNFKMKRRNNE